MSAGDRRDLLADSVIRTLAARGSRGLTHRAVDETAGLPSGSSTYYLRSRAELLVAATERLAEVDTRAVTDLPGDDPTADLTRLLDHTLTGEGRDRTIARYELSLEAIRRPEIQVALAAGTARVHTAVSDYLRRLGVPEPHDAADDLLAQLDGLLFAEVTGTGHRQGPGVVRAGIDRALRRLVDRPTRLTSS